MRKAPIPFEGKLLIKKGDTVMVLAGKDKGKTGLVKRAYPKSGKVLVEGINVVTRHVKAQPTPDNPNPEGGRVQAEVPILACKVALLNHEGKPTRVKIEIGKDGKKTRIAAKGGKPIADPAK
jgi:large subunit ribosomal protein L24